VWATLIFEATQTQNGVLLMNYRVTRFGFALLLLVSFQYANAANAKESYELQEKCGKRAEELFHSQYGKENIINSKDGQAIVSYENHYNEKLNRCFSLISYSFFPNKTSTQKPSRQISLSSINENKELGSIFIFIETNKLMGCEVSGKKCAAESEWNTLVAPYMNE
jgi:hypothetical protein